MADDTQGIPKNLVSGTVIAKIIGRSVRTVQNLTADGVIKTTAVKGSNRKYDLLPTLMAYIKHLQDRADGKVQKDKELELKEAKLKAEVELKESQGELHKIRTAIAAGRYVDVEEVQLEYRRFFVQFKRFALAVPNRVGGIIGNSLDPVEARRLEKEIADDITQMLEAFISSAKLDPVKEDRAHGKAEA